MKYLLFIIIQVTILHNLNRYGYFDRFLANSADKFLVDQKHEAKSSNLNKNIQFIYFANIKLG